MIVKSGYFSSQEDFENVKREISADQPGGTYCGHIQDIAAVIYEHNRRFAGKDIHYGRLIEMYAQSNYPGLKNQERGKKALSKKYEYSNKPPPIDEAIILEKIVVNHGVFKSWLMQNQHRILVGALLPDDKL